MVLEVLVTLDKSHFLITKENYKNDHFTAFVAYYLTIKSIQWCNSNKNNSALVKVSNIIYLLKSNRMTKISK